MNKNRLLLLLILLLTFPWSIQAQPAEKRSQKLSRTDSLITIWWHRQDSLLQQIQYIQCDETSLYVIDAPFGIRRIEVKARLTIHYPSNPLEEPRIRRRIVQVSLNGKQVPPQRLQQLRRGKHEWNILQQRMRQFISIAPILPAYTRALSPMLPDTLNRQPVWRIEVYPQRDLKWPLDRMTLWFSPPLSDPHLKYLRMLLRPSRKRGQSNLYFWYQPINEVDLPVRFQLEHIRTFRKRIRTYTILTTITSRFSNYKIIWKS